MAANEELGIERISSLHFFVRDLERSRDHYIENLGFTQVAVSTRDFEADHRARASVLEAGRVRLVLIEPLGSRGESFRWLEKHPEGLGRVVFDVPDAQRAFKLLTSRGATPLTGIEHRRVEGGLVRWFDIATAIGDTLFRFVQHEGTVPIMPDLERVAHAPEENPLGIVAVDHITSNFLTLQPALSWMQEVMGFERYWAIDFHTQDVSEGTTTGSGLRSVVMRDPHSGLKFANNEPAQPFFKASQIFLFCEDHRGAGVQHVAFSVKNLPHTVSALRQKGMDFMPTPPSYYDMLPERLERIGVGKIEEDVELLRKHQILVDGHEPGRYMLQIFMKDAAAMFRDVQAGPLFIELLERKGDQGFGGGNFRALFDSIEQQQREDGRVSPAGGAAG